MGRLQVCQFRWRSISRGAMVYLLDLGANRFCNRSSLVIFATPDSGARGRSRGVSPEARTTPKPGMSIAHWELSAFTAN